jgi:hypothetical protein
MLLHQDRQDIRSLMVCFFLPAYKTKTRPKANAHKQAQARHRHRQLLSSRVSVLRVWRSSQDSSHCNFSSVHHLFCPQAFCVHHKTCSRPGIPRLGGLRASVVAWHAEATPWGSFEVSCCSFSKGRLWYCGVGMSGEDAPRPCSENLIVTTKNKKQTDILKSSLLLPCHDNIYCAATGRSAAAACISFMNSLSQLQSPNASHTKYKS